MTLKSIPLRDLHASLGGKMVPFAGFEMPVRYSSDKEEHLAVRNSVGVFDVSHMGEFFVTGPNALELIQHVTSNDASKLVDGQAQYSCFPNEEGGVIDDLIVYRFNAEKYMLVVNASNIDKDWNWITKHNHAGANLENKSEDYTLLAVQGPKAQVVLQKLTDVDLTTIKFYHFTEGLLAGAKMIISGTGYTGAGGFELYVDKNDSKKVWDAIFEAGAEFDIKPIGLGARDTLRMEMGYCLYGNDIDDTTSPLEAGLGWITKFSKDFINSENLKSQKEMGVGKKLVSFKLTEKGVPRSGYRILNEAGEEIGLVTSGTMSPSINVGIGMGYVKTGSHVADTPVFIEVRNKSLKAIVKKAPLI
ncbi:MAG: glycine cleavage system aminomethyltransferase GcvT [Cyclobacteriaceae bacterium]